MSKAKLSFVILRFDIRYSAVRCLIQIIEAANIVIKKTFHFGVVSHEKISPNGLMTAKRISSRQTTENGYCLTTQKNCSQMNLTISGLLT